MDPRAPKPNMAVLKRTKNVKTYGRRHSMRDYISWDDVQLEDSQEIRRGEVRENSKAERERQVQSLLSC